MALIPCYECEKEISDKAPACPHCGAPKEGRPPQVEGQTEEIPEKKGKPDIWSTKLWDAYKLYGESDKKYVESCNRFLGVMLDLRFHETSELVRGLQHAMILNEEVEVPEEFKSGIPSVDLHLSKQKGQRSNLDVLDVYKDWYEEYVKWPKECLCSREDVVLESGTIISRSAPWFLTACIQLARQGLSGVISMDVDIADFLIRAGHEIETFMAKGLWRITETPTFGYKMTGEDLDVQDQRYPDEKRKHYINRVLQTVNDHLMHGMTQVDQIRQHPIVPLEGNPLDPTNKHEEMLVRKMFGAKNFQIEEAMQDALINKSGERVTQPEKTIEKRLDLIVRHLGFKPPNV